MDANQSSTGTIEASGSTVPWVAFQILMDQAGEDSLWECTDLLLVCESLTNHDTCVIAKFNNCFIIQLLCLVLKK